MAETKRIVAIIGTGAAGQRAAKALLRSSELARRILAEAEAREQERIRQEKELEAFQLYYNLSDEYVAKMRQAAEEYGITMAEVMDAIEKASVFMREAWTIVADTFDRIRPMMEDINDLYREQLRESRKDRPYRLNPPQAKIRPYRIIDKGFDKRKPYMFRNYRRRNK